MKTTKKDFERFQAEFLKWWKLLGLTEWRCVFFHEPLDGCYADICCDHSGRVASVRYSSRLPYDTGDHDPLRHARHEALELLLASLENVARSRFCIPDEVVESRHAVIRRLESLLDGMEPRGKGERC